MSSIPSSLSPTTSSDYVSNTFAWVLLLLLVLLIILLATMIGLEILAESKFEEV